MWKCKHCNKEFKDLSPSEKANHSRWCINNPKREAYLKKLESTRKNINIEARKKQGKNLKIAWEKGKFSDVDYSKFFFRKKHSNETKKIMSEKRKKYLLENPDKHPWIKNDRFSSQPCEFLKNKLKERKIKFQEEYKPLFPDRFFSIDIAFPDRKIGIEINGNQHYNKDKTLKKYYKERHDLIEEKGWKIYEFHYLLVFNDNIIETIEKIIAL